MNGHRSVGDLLWQAQAYTSLLFALLGPDEVKGLKDGADGEDNEEDHDGLHGRPVVGGVFGLEEIRGNNVTNL